MPGLGSAPKGVERGRDFFDAAALEAPLARGLFVFLGRREVNVDFFDLLLVAFDLQHRLQHIGQRVTRGGRQLIGPHENARRLDLRDVFSQCHRDLLTQ